MAKLKNPLLSLDATGSLSDSLTFTKRRGVDIAERKPRLPYFLTLPVQYQRWLYQDYAYYWTTQSPATKQFYASAGVPFHLTGFQYWMKYHLTKLPDIAGMWHLDEKAGAIAYDSSRNGNHGTIIGATPATGVIDGALSFDGINDEVRFPATLAPDLTDQPYTIEFDIYNNIINNNRFPLSKGSLGVDPGFDFNTFTAPDKINHRIFDQALNIVSTGSALLPTGWSRIAGIRTPTHLQLWINAILKKSVLIGPVGSISTTQRLYFGRSSFGIHARVYEDHIIIYTRVLDQTELIRHSERRFP